PPFPQPRGCRCARFLCVCNPEQLQHRVAKEEAPAGGALSRMPVRRTFPHAEIAQPVAYGCADCGADEHVIQHGGHGWADDLTKPAPAEDVTIGRLSPVMMPFNDLNRTPPALRAELAASVQRVLDRGWYILG